MSIKTETNLKYSRIWIEEATNFNKINLKNIFLFLMTKIKLCTISCFAGISDSAKMLVTVQNILASSVCDLKSVEAFCHKTIIYSL